MYANQYMYGLMKIATNGIIHHYANICMRLCFIKRKLRSTKQKKCQSNHQKPFKCIPKTMDFFNFSLQCCFYRLLTNGHHLQMHTKSTNNCLISGILMKLHPDRRNEIMKNFSSKQYSLNCS